MTRFADLVDTSRRVASTSARNAKIAAMAGFLRKLERNEIPVAAAYLSGETRQGRFGIGYALMRDGTPSSEVAEPTLSLTEVDQALAAIARTKGAGSKTVRLSLLSAMLARATRDEREFLFRLMQGELRQGALESLMIDAVAAAADLPVASVRRAAMLAHGVVAVAEAALTQGAEGLTRFSIALMQPIAPMLAQPADDVADALQRFGRAAFEWKLDGARVQVHKSGNDVRVFTRRRNDVTASAPEIVDALRGVPARELILDGEAISLGAQGAPHAFQDTMRRFGRTLDIEAMQQALPLSVFFFDCLRLDDQTLLGAPAGERFEALAGALPEKLRIPRIVTDDATTAVAFYDDALARGHEGVMAKALDAPYEPGKRTSAWLKVKKLHTLDLVVLAAEWGHGRRQGWLSNLHLAARDGDAFVMLGKTFKGMTDDMLAWQTRELLARETRRDAWTVYVRPELVVEVAFNDLQESPRYPGGLALRFARIKRYRTDKGAPESDTMTTVRAIYAGQLARSAAG